MGLKVRFNKWEDLFELLKRRWIRREEGAHPFRIVRCKQKEVPKLFRIESIDLQHLLYRLVVEIIGQFVLVTNMTLFVAVDELLNDCRIPTILEIIQLRSVETLYC